jgi:hypothetical protein
MSNDLLQPIRELLSGPEKWCKGAFARTAWGNTIDSADPGAISFCLIGAVNHCYPWPSPQNQKVKTALRQRLTKELMNFNDIPETTFADIQALLKEPLYASNGEQR